MGLEQVLAISDTQDNGEETRSVVSNSPARLVADMASLLLGVDQAPTSVRGTTRRGADGSTRPSSNPQKDWPHLSYPAPATPRSPGGTWQPALRVCEARGTTGLPTARRVRLLRTLTRRWHEHSPRSWGLSLTPNSAPGLNQPHTWSSRPYFAEIRWVPYISPQNLIGSDCCWRSAGRNGSPV